jgi:hypothetical protein
MNETDHVYVTIGGRGTFRLEFHPIAGSDGVEEVQYTGSVYVQRHAEDGEWDFFNRCVTVIRDEIGAD